MVDLARLNMEIPEWANAPSLELVARLEWRLRLSLPSDYREFLAQHGGATLDAICEFQEPTPFEQTARFTQFFGFMPEEHELRDVEWNTDLIDGAPDVVAIAQDPYGGMYWLKCSGDDTGHVFYNDPDGRCSWTDEQFYQSFSNLAPEIERYLQLRREGLLPKKRNGYGNVYLVARSFTALLQSLSPYSFDDEA